MFSCNPTDCTNGVQDGNETGVDCGGDCPNCATPVVQNSTLYDVEYRFLGGDCSLQYMNGTESYDQLSSVVGTWNYTCQKSTGDVLYIHSYNDVSQTGSHQVQVLLDGVVFKEANSSGPDTYAIIQEILN